MMDLRAFSPFAPAATGNLSSASECGQDEEAAWGQGWSSDLSTKDASMKILLLEDHSAMREIISDYLVQRGFVVDAVAQGGAALAAVATGSYDAMVLDLGLPDMDGMEVLSQIRAFTADRLPALIITARDSLESRVEGLDSGADDYILKPFELLELEARLRAVLRRPGQRASFTYTCGSLTFDATARHALVDDVPLELSRREAALLEVLMRGAGRIVVKDALEDRLYSFDQEVTSNALEASVSRLRKKLAVAKAGVRVETARGIGYRIVPGDDLGT